MLARRFYSCSVAVNCGCLKVFVYVFMMWHCGTTYFTAGSFDKLRSAYVKCIKVFLGYTQFYSVAAMLTELNLQKFDSLIDKCRNDFQRQIYGCDNDIVQHFVRPMWLIYVMCNCIAAFFCLSLCLFTVLFFYVFYCSMGPVPEIKIDWFR